MTRNVTIRDMLDGQAARAASVEDAGAVLTRERNLEADAWVSLFQALNADGSAKGIMILWQQLVGQRKGPRVCTVQQQHRFSWEVIHPFDESRPDGRTSEDEFIEKVEAVNSALNLVVGTAQPWNLDIALEGSDVEHQFLQGDGDAFVRRWGAGATAIKTHYASFTLDVLCVVSTHG